MRTISLLFFVLLLDINKVEAQDTLHAQNLVYEKVKLNASDKATKTSSTSMMQEFNPIDTSGGATVVITDYDGNNYHTVAIGTQVWLKENLKTTKYNDGSDIPLVTLIAKDSILKTEAYFTYNNTTNVDTINTYGRLYNWYTVSTGKLCPIGWHVPDDIEWKTLINYLASKGYGYRGNGDDIAKSISAKTCWDKSSKSGTPGNILSSNNISGFTAFPGGYYNYNGISYSLTGYGCWWSFSSTCKKDCVSGWILYYNDKYLEKEEFNKCMGFSVRCLRD
jgi:uncharacterized protein (TIGR02145 family)